MSSLIYKNDAAGPFDIYKITPIKFSNPKFYRVVRRMRNILPFIILA
jgi:hypothetical protein